jgi:DNA-binding IclR family transcriptional regulator
MGRSSPAVGRVAAILNFIASHPGQAFTLTDLVRALKLSRATCHALLMGLVEVGYLYRASDKHYVLGPALVAIGRSAAEHASPLQIAQPEMRALADEFDALCTAFVRDGHDLVVVGRAASVSHLSGSGWRGTRLRLHPPAAAVFFARSSEAEIDAWLDSFVTRPTAEERASLHGVLAFIREHGYGVVVNDPPPADGAWQERFGAYEQRNFPISELTEMSLDETYDLAAVTGSVFEADNQVAYVISLSLGRRMTGAEIAAIGERLREACDRISEYITGRQPRIRQIAF